MFRQNIPGLTAMSQLRVKINGEYRLPGTLPLLLQVCKLLHDEINIGLRNGYMQCVGHIKFKQ